MLNWIIKRLGLVTEARLQAEMDGAVLAAYEVFEQRAGRLHRAIRALAQLVPGGHNVVARILADDDFDMDPTGKEDI